MPPFEPVNREKPATASDLIQAEIARLKARKAGLEGCRPSYQENIKALEQGGQALEDEIQTIGATIDRLGADRKKLNGK